MTGGYRKIKLFSLMVALVALGLAVVGGTWASQDKLDYQDEKNIEYEKNEHLDYAVELNYYNGTGYVTALGEGVNVFNGSAWCPGKTEIVYLQIKNKEGFPVDVALTLVPKEADNNKKRFGEVLTAAWLVSESDLRETVTSTYKNWGEFSEEAKDVKPLTNDVEVLKNGEAGGMQNVILSSGAQYIALAVHMSESASSDYAKLGLNLSFNLRVNADQAPTTTPQ